MSRYLLGMLACVSTASALWGALPSRFHEFAHVADGDGINTVILVMNKTGTQVSVTVEFFDGNGDPMTVAIDGTAASQFQFNLEVGAMNRLETSGQSSPLKVGWARIRATGEVGAQIVFQIQAGGVITTQAAVESIGPLTGADIFVEQQGSNRTGLAVASASEVGSISVQMTIFDEAGTQTRQETITLDPLAKDARFLDEFFSNLGNVRGTLRIAASGPITITVLQQAGLILGTLTPLEIF